jgi:hypothetical protein
MGVETPMVRSPFQSGYQNEGGCKDGAIEASAWTSQLKAYLRQGREQPLLVIPRSPKKYGAAGQLAYYYNRF